MTPDTFCSLLGCHNRFAALTKMVSSAMAQADGAPELRVDGPEVKAAVATARYRWPGKDWLRCCAGCLARASGIARVMGFELQHEPVQVDAEEFTPSRTRVDRGGVASVEVASKQAQALAPSEGDGDFAEK